MPAMADLTIGGSSRYTVRTIDGDYANDGRVQMSIAGSTTSESGAFVSGKAVYNFNMGAAEGTDDVTMTIGNAMANVQLGEFEMHKTFASGADTFQASVGAAVAAVAGTNASGDNATLAGGSAAVAASAAQGYEGDAQSRARSLNNIAFNYTGIEGTVVQLGTTLTDTDNDVRLGVETSIAGLSVGANYEIDGAAASNDGWAVKVGGTFGDVGATVSTASNDAGNASTNLTVTYMGLSVSAQKDKTDAAGIPDTDHLYGSYTVKDIMGVTGASVEIGAGTADAGDESVDEMGVRLSYTF
jgi:hypothetical protein